MMARNAAVLATSCLAISMLAANMTQELAEALRASEVIKGARSARCRSRAPR